MLKNCEYCGGPFPRRRFCSIECKDEWHKKQKRLINAERLKTCPVPERHCNFCQKLFTPSRRCNEEQCFCSRKCKNDQHAQNQRAARAVLRAQTKRICPICEKEFNPKYSMRETYCSPKCRNAIAKRMYKMLQTVRLQTGQRKVRKTYDILGYDRNDLFNHLQTFPQWGSLKNETWHLDHIFPIIAFTRRGIRDPKVICALSNLQPLPGPENEKKNDNYDESEFEKYLTESLS